MSSRGGTHFGFPLFGSTHLEVMSPPVPDRFIRWWFASSCQWIVELTAVSKDGSFVFLVCSGFLFENIPCCPLCRLPESWRAGICLVRGILRREETVDFACLSGTLDLTN